MADKRKMKRKGKDKGGDGDSAPTKEEKAVATHVRFTCPTKTTMCNGDEVHYFTASKAIDCLLESKWAAGKSKGEPLFTNRATCAIYMQTLMDKGMFWRARKLVPRRKERPTSEQTSSAAAAAKSSKNNTDDPDGKGTPKKSRKKEKETKEKMKADGDAEAEGEQDGDKKEQEEEKADEGNGNGAMKKKKKKIKLEFHPDQIFRDGVDVYVWHFDPVSWTKFLIGLGLVIGAIVVCLFPLWPHWLRLGVYYLSLVAMGFVGVLLGLIVVRGILFCCVWAATLGRHYFWFLPNLTEDCGFFESFQPLYSHTFVPRDGEETTSREKKKKEKDSDAEDDDEDGDQEKEENDENDNEDNEGGKGDEHTDTDRRSDDDSENDSQQSDTKDRHNNRDDTQSETGGDSTQNTPKHLRHRHHVQHADENDTNGFEMVN